MPCYPQPSRLSIPLPSWPLAPFHPDRAFRRIYETDPRGNLKGFSNASIGAFTADSILRKLAFIVGVAATEVGTYALPPSLPPLADLEKLDVDAVEGKAAAMERWADTHAALSK